MRVLAVCESPPTTHARHGNGSTLISAHLLARLPQDWDLDLVWFADRPVSPDVEVLRRADRRVELGLAPGAIVWPVSVLRGVPRATQARTGADARRRIRALTGDADVVYLHGLHTFGHVFPGPVVVHEVDPWSSHWEERATRGDFVRGAYDRLQARGARRLEERAAECASTYLVVSEADAAALAGRLDREVVALPNGIDLDVFSPRDDGDGRTVAFVGTLDYPPNLEAVRVLRHRIWPEVRRRVPASRLVLAGRRPTPEVRAMAAEDVSVLGDVDDVRDVYAAASVLAYPGDMGRGTKNTLLEAMAMGCPVVASPSAARNLDGDHVLTPADDQGFIEGIVGLLGDPSSREALGLAARAYAERHRSWDAVAGRFAASLEDAVRLART